MEFYIFNEELWYMHNGENARLTENNTELVGFISDKISEYFPDAYKSLVDYYKKSSYNTSYFRFLIVRRFCKCNFGELDTRKQDIDSLFRFHTEHMKCPLRGECKLEGIVCMPRFNCKLSDAEIRVMKMLYEGSSKEDIAEELFISPNTVKNHIHSAYCKTGVKDLAGFIRYANENELWQ